jgi:hypothetical protein
VTSGVSDYNFLTMQLRGTDALIDFAAFNCTDILLSVGTISVNFVKLNFEKITNKIK